MGNLLSGNRLHPSSNSGLTLMELLVVLALMVIVIGVVYSFFDFINKSSQRSGDQYQLQSNLGNAIDFISRELRNVKYIEIVTIDPDTDTSDRQYIYIYTDTDTDKNILKHKNAGTEKSEAFFTDDTQFTISEENAPFTISFENGRYYVEIDLQGNRRGKDGEDYTLNTKILLNNITSATAASGKTIRYEK